MPVQPHTGCALHHFKSLTAPVHTKQCRCKETSWQFLKLVCSDRQEGLLSHGPHWPRFPAQHSPSFLETERARSPGAGLTPPHTTPEQPKLFPQIMLLFFLMVGFTAFCTDLFLAILQATLRPQVEKREFKNHLYNSL